MPQHYFQTGRPRFGGPGGQFGRVRQADLTSSQQRMLAEQHLGQLGLLGGPPPVDPLSGLNQQRLANAQSRIQHARQLQQGTLGQTPIPNATALGGLARGGATGEVFRESNRSLSPLTSPALGAAIARDAALQAQIDAEGPLGRSGAIRNREGTIIGQGLMTGRKTEQGLVPIGETPARARYAAKVKERRRRLEEGEFSQKATARKQRLEARKLQQMGLSPLQALAMQGGGEGGNIMQQYAQIAAIMGEPAAAQFMINQMNQQGATQRAQMAQQGAANVAGIQGQTSRDVAGIQGETGRDIAGIQGQTATDVAGIGAKGGTDVATIREGGATGRAEERNKMTEKLHKEEMKQRDADRKARSAAAKGDLKEERRSNKEAEKARNRQIAIQEKLAGMPVEGEVQTPQSALQSIVERSGEEEANRLNADVRGALEGNMFSTTQSRLANMTEVVNDALERGLADPQSIATLIRTNADPEDLRALQVEVNKVHADPRMIQIAGLLGIRPTETVVPDYETDRRNNMLFDAFLRGVGGPGAEPRFGSPIPPFGAPFGG